MSARQSARSVLMVSPASFAFDTQTAVSNKFQVKPALAPAAITAQAMSEFRAAVATLRGANIDVTVHEGDASENKPSAVFPNNWISTWPNGKVFTYPMATASRRTERDNSVLNQLAGKFFIDQTVDLSAEEANGKYLESTGVLVFDHLEKVAYGCLSERCDEELFTAHVESLGYQPITFHGYDQSGVAIYHTNVMLGIQSTTAVICSEAITDAAERRRVLAALKRGHDVIDISFEQLNSFCGNTLELENRYGEKYLALSQTAYDAFTPEQRRRLSRDKKLLPISIPTLEGAGGGSVRCMLAEIFLSAMPRNDTPARGYSAKVRPKKTAVSV